MVDFYLLLIDLKTKKNIMVVISKKYKKNSLKEFNNNFKYKSTSSIYYNLFSIPDKSEIIMKNLSTIKLENPILAIQGFKIQQDIKDSPRRVT